MQVQRSGPGSSLIGDGREEYRACPRAVAAAEPSTTDHVEFEGVHGRDITLEVSILGGSATVLAEGWSSSRRPLLRKDDDGVEG